MACKVIGDSCDPWGFASRIECDGQEYHQTGNNYGRAIYCKAGDFERACKGFSDELLYVLDYYRMIPFADFKKSREESGLPPNSP